MAIEQSFYHLITVHPCSYTQACGLYHDTFHKFSLQTMKSTLHLPKPSHLRRLIPNPTPTHLHPPLRSGSNSAPWISYCNEVQLPVGVIYVTAKNHYKSHMMLSFYLII